MQGASIQLLGFVHDLRISEQSSQMAAGYGSNSPVEGWIVAEAFMDMGEPHPVETHIGKKACGRKD